MRLVRFQGGSIIDDVGAKKFTNVELQMNNAIEALTPPRKEQPILAEDQRIILSLQE